MTPTDCVLTGFSPPNFPSIFFVLKTIIENQKAFLNKELKLSPQETRYLLLLLDHERSAVMERKAELTQEIEQMQQEHLQTEKYLQAEIEDLSLVQRYVVERSQSMCSARIPRYN